MILQEPTDVMVTRLRMWIKTGTVKPVLHGHPVRRPPFIYSQLFNNAQYSILCNIFIGLWKERPILDHHAKAHIADFIKSGGFQVVKSGGFCEIQQISGEIHPKPYKIRCFNKNSSVWGVHGGGYDPGFHEIQGHSPSPAFIKLNSFG